MNEHPKEEDTTDSRGVRAYFGELIGTFLLVFVGTATIVVGQDIMGWSGPPNHTELLTIALSFGFILTTIVYTLGNISGAQVNPAISIGMWSVGWMNTRDLIGYVVAQFAGATLASSLVMAVWGTGSESAPLGANVVNPELTTVQAMGVEVVLTFILAWTVAAVLLDHRIPHAAAGIAIGGVLFVLHLPGVHLTGASMNPARTFGPAVIGGHWANFLSVYVIAPVIGGLLGAWCFRFVGIKAPEEEE